MNSYSQFGQDNWVLSYFKTGKFVEVGFHDGISMSNTYLLELNGWNGIGIDPFPKNFTFRKNTIIEQACVFNKEIDIEFTLAKESSWSGISSSLDNNHKNHSWITSGQKIMIKSYRLEYFLQKYSFPKRIEYLSIDTEGSELEILSSFSFDKYLFGCISCEHNDDEYKRNNIRLFLESKGYILDKTLGVDDCYIHNTVLKQIFL